MYIVWIAAIGVFIIFFSMGIFGSGSSSNNNLKPNSTSINTLGATQPLVSSSNSTFNQISQVDKTRMTEIITGVIQNTTPITPEIKKEIKDIFKKYNTTDTEIKDFSIYGPVFMANYQKLFYTDALQAVSTGISVKSNERLNLEKEALSRGIMTAERIKTNNETMGMIASNQSIINSSGQGVLFTTDNIKSTLNDIDSMTERFKSLFE